MKILHIAAVALLANAAVPFMASAGPIESACNRSDRQQATRSLCRCIDNVADRSLTRSEQREVAQFFSNPQRAQDVRMSSSSRDNQLWDRYRAFGVAAERSCS
jgi:hypothetical protein